MAKHDPVKDLPAVTGRDEMNLAEFAIGLASDRNTKQIKTVERKQTMFLANGTKLEQIWTVTGSDKHGLPRAGDDDVLLALLKLASDRGLQERRVFFSRYELMQILDWVPNGRNYQRFESSLERLAGVRILAKNSFWDHSRKSYTSMNFGLIDDYIIVDRREHCAQPEGQLEEMPLTHVSFNEKFFQSMQVGNMKRLDMRLYNALGSALSKRLYRYLDKRRYRTNVFDVDMYTLATVNLGLDLSTRRYASQIKQLLDPAHRELQSHGFLKSWDYRWSEDRSTWFIQYAFAKAKQDSSEDNKPVPESCAAQTLVKRGFSASLASRLASQFADRIPAKLDMFDQLIMARSPLLARNPLGWLRKAIEDDYQQVRGYEPPDVRQKKAQKAEASAKKEKDADRQLQEEKDRLWQRYQSLPADQRSSLFEKAKSEFRFLPPHKLNTLTEDSPIIRGAILALLEEAPADRLSA